MKRIIGLLVFTLFLGNAFAQKISQGNVPAAVINAFQLKSPNATDANWKLEKGYYRVKYKVNSKDNKLNLDNNGNMLKHEQDLYDSEIPHVAMETIQSKVAFYDVNDADRVEENGKITYEINLEISAKDHDFWIDETGSLLKYVKELKDSEVPTAILSMIDTNYGTFEIKNSKYIVESGSVYYILRGDINDKYHFFIINDKLTMLKHKQDLRNTEIPVSVLNASKAAYPEYEIRDADLIEEGGIATYSLQMKKSKEKIRVVFNTNGKVVEVK